jgi:peroxiredoxin
MLFSALPARAQQQVAFGERPNREVVLPQFTDADVARLVSTLDAVLPADPPNDYWSDAARMPLWEFVRRLQDGHLSADQEARVLLHLDELERTHPSAAGAVADARRAVTRLTVGKPAPDIIGVDLDGMPLKLSDHRGRVVVLKFGGSWCAICRSEYPYDRFLLNLYATWPFAMLGVDGSDSAAHAREAQNRQGLPYRAWWDGRSGPGGRGPIAAEWNVLGWPTTYVIDGQGIIRFVDLRAEDLLKAVRQLLIEEVRRTLKAGEGEQEN